MIYLIILMIFDEKKKTLSIFIITFIKLRFRDLLILIINGKLIELSIFEFLLFVFLVYSVLIIYMIKTTFKTMYPCIDIDTLIFFIYLFIIIYYYNILLILLKSLSIALYK